MAAYKFQIRESYDLTALKRKNKFKYKWLAMCCWIIWCWSIVFLLESNFTIFTVQENSCQHQSKRREIVKRMQVQYSRNKTRRNTEAKPDRFYTDSVYLRLRWGEALRMRANVRSRMITRLKILKKHP